MHCFNYFDLNQPTNPISLGLGYLFALMVISIISGDKYLQNIAFQWLHSTHFWVKDIIAIIIMFMVVIFIIFIFMTTYWWPSLSSGSPLKFLIIRTHDGAMMMMIGTKISQCNAHVHFGRLFNSPTYFLPLFLSCPDGATTSFSIIIIVEKNTVTFKMFGDGQGR